MGLIQRKRGAEFKGGDINPELVRIREIYHIVMALHCADWRGQKAARTVGMRLSRAYYRLLANNTLAV